MCSLDLKCVLNSDLDHFCPSSTHLRVSTHGARILQCSIESKGVGHCIKVSKTVSREISVHSRKTQSLGDFVNDSTKSRSVVVNNTVECRKDGIAAYSFDLPGVTPDTIIIVDSITVLVSIFRTTSTVHETDNIVFFHIAECFNGFEETWM